MVETILEVRKQQRNRETVAVAVVLQVEKVVGSNCGSHGEDERVVLSVGGRIGKEEVVSR